MGAVGGILGGGGSEGDSQSSSASGYNAMPAIEQHAYDPFFNAISSLWGTPVNPFQAPLSGLLLSDGYFQF